LDVPTVDVTKFLKTVSEFPQERRGIWIPEDRYPIRRNSSDLLRALQAVIAIYDA
jgi:hypothetical protein